MTMLHDVYAPAQAEKCRVIILDSPEEVHEYHACGGRIPADGQLFGRYWVQPLGDAALVPSPGVLLTADQFTAQYSKVAPPVAEYGIQAHGRDDQVVRHESLDAARGALDDLPVLRDSGHYRLVQRQPGARSWEPVPA